MEMLLLSTQSHISWHTSEENTCNTQQASTAPLAFYKWLFMQPVEMNALKVQDKQVWKTAMHTIIHY